MVDYAISTYLTVLVLLEIDVYAETLFEGEDKLLKLLLLFFTQRLSVFVEDFLYIRNGLGLSRFFLLGLRDFGTFETLILSLGNLSLIFLDNGTKLGCSVLTFLAVLGNMLEYISDRDIPCIAAILQKAVSVKRLFHL